MLTISINAQTMEEVMEEKKSKLKEMFFHQKMKYFKEKVRF